MFIDPDLIKFRRIQISIRSNLKALGLLISAAGVILLFIYTFFINNEALAFILGGVFLVTGAALIVGSIKKKE